MHLLLQEMPLPSELFGTFDIGGRLTSPQGKRADTFRLGNNAKMKQFTAQMQGRPSYVLHPVLQLLHNKAAKQPEYIEEPALMSALGELSGMTLGYNLFQVPENRYYAMNMLRAMGFQAAFSDYNVTFSNLHDGENDMAHVKLVKALSNYPIAFQNHGLNVPIEHMLSNHGLVSEKNEQSIEHLLTYSFYKLTISW